ncbi:MAG TPA: CoA ester lyase [Gaiellaceae bacterium]|jgi:citrate lyase subunit beta/citryl-CoA lyase
MNKRRSCLTVPADDERKLARAAGVAADEVIIDLEDAVAPERKDAARETAARALRDLTWAAPTVAVRVNGARTAWHADDLLVAREAAVVVVPKVESPYELEGLGACEALIETARGLVDCEAIAQTAGLEALVFGPGDLAASLGVPALTIGEGAHSDYALARILVAARANGVQAIDGPFPYHADANGLRASAQRSRAFGYDGKWCIHPSQVELCNEIYAPTEEELERARRILASSGVTSVDGEMIDEANRRMAEAIVARAG